MTLRCVAIDDEPRALSVLGNHASRTELVDLLESFVDPFAAIDYINSNAVDLVFLDINMPEIDGLRLVKCLTNKPLIVFTTAHSEYAIESYEVEALDYLLKPFDYTRFIAAVHKAKARREAEAQVVPAAFLFVNTGNQKQRIVVDELQYLVSEGNYVRYVATSGSYLVRASIKDTLRSLSPAAFMQVHRSYIVALRWVDKIEESSVFIAQT
ncbi:MAG: response regulator transcription factor, partial [Bacteroidota bacterium]